MTNLKGDIRGAPLSYCEWGTLIMIALGYSNKEVSNVLCICEQTVKNQVTHIMRKLDARNRAHCVTRGFDKGYLS